MNRNPLVSVIIPNYNHSSFLPERIDSVLHQTFQNFEVIILDDCSTDNSRDIIERYRSNPQISHIIYNSENSGKVFMQWKRGIELAAGELIWIAESDDISDINFLEILVNKFIKHPSLSLAFCKSWMFNNKGYQWEASQNVSEGVYNGSAFISDVMSRGCIMYNASSCLFRKASFKCIDDIYTTFTASGDRMFWILICEQGDVFVVDKRMNYYRKHGDNSTERTFLQGINQKETKRILDYLLSKGYIKQNMYKKLREEVLRKCVFEFLTDEKLKKEIYEYWGYKWYQQRLFKLDAYIKNIIGLFCRRSN